MPLPPDSAWWTSITGIAGARILLWTDPVDPAFGVVLRRQRPGPIYGILQPNGEWDESTGVPDGNEMRFRQGITGAQQGGQGAFMVADDDPTYVYFAATVSGGVYSNWKEFAFLTDILVGEIYVRYDVRR